MEHFTVSQAVPFRKGTKLRVYKLVNYNDEAVRDSWFLEELQDILANQYRIKKDLQRRTHLAPLKYICLVGQLA